MSTTLDSDQTCKIIFEKETTILLDKAISKLLKTALLNINPDSESSAVFAISQIPGLELKEVGYLGDFGEPETSSDGIYIEAIYNGFLRFGFTLLSAYFGWFVDEILYREVNMDAFKMLEFLSSVISTTEDSEQKETFCDDPLIPVFEDEDNEDKNDEYDRELKM